MLAYRRFVCTLLAGFAFASTGCGGPQPVTVTGTVLRDGKPLEVSPTGVVQVILYTDVPPGGEFTSYPGRADATGKFEVTEVPAGRYKVSVQQFDPNPMTDALRGAFNQQNTKFVKDIDGKTPIEIDLAK